MEGNPGVGLVVIGFFMLFVVAAAWGLDDIDVKEEEEDF